jgi:hypothetical protein
VLSWAAVLETRKDERGAGNIDSMALFSRSLLAISVCKAKEASQSARKRFKCVAIEAQQTRRRRGGKKSIGGIHRQPWTLLVAPYLAHYLRRPVSSLLYPHPAPPGRQSPSSPRATTASTGRSLIRQGGRNIAQGALPLPMPEYGRYLCAMRLLRTPKTGNNALSRYACR